MSQGILITQCLQNDFVQLLEKYDPLPNNLHIGYDESKRLLGERPEEGPVANIMDWAYSLPEDDLTIIHIRDWHDEEDSHQEGHLHQFGNHCIKDTRGAEFVFSESIHPERKHHIVNASGLNDFYNTGLENILSPYTGAPVRVGLIGVWTEAKVSFLAYELATRYENFKIALCSTLTASSSRAMHFVALDQLKNIFGVKIFSSIGAFTSFLAGSMPTIVHDIHRSLDISRIHLDADCEVSEVDKKLLLYLFRECSKIEGTCLDGGFSGNVVLKARSLDLMGHVQVPSVIKIGDRDMIAKERIAFERIQEVLGNNAPAIVDFAEIENRGAIKYRYASMLDGNVRTLQDLYAERNIEDLKPIFDTVFIKQLGRLYEAAVSEKLNLLEYYDFSAKYAGGVRKRVESLQGIKADSEIISYLSGIDIPNVCLFYEKDLLTLKEYSAVSHYIAYGHGDLNGRNIIIDNQENVWLIDFFHTHQGHVIRDLVKLENDILYIWTPVNSEEELREAVRLSELLINIHDLGIPLDTEVTFKYPQFEKAYRTIAYLRSYYPGLIRSDRDPYQLHVGLMRYAIHNLSFDESNEFQRKWALYSGTLCSEKIKQYILKSKELRIDYIEFPKGEYDSSLGITILPGRKDRERNMNDDIEKIKSEGIDNIMCLLTEDEFQEYGVSNLKEIYSKAGFTVNYLQVMDQGVPTKAVMEKGIEWVHSILQGGEKVLLHCVGGLGRSGTAAACYLVQKYALSPEEAISRVRQSRSQRAIESKEQVEFIYEF
ncbi:MAG: isochorismatase family protein [bacterium]|nr:isochorismatase family protein [bacterium]